MSTTWASRVQRLEEAVAAWQSRLLDPQTPEPGSSLAKDDETFPPLPCSQLAWWGLAVAVEHLDAGLRLLADQAARRGPYFSDANYTVLRAALLGASRAAAVLLPTARVTRTTYGLQLAHEEFRRALNLRKHLHGHEGLPDGVRAASTHKRFIDGLEAPLKRTSSVLAERGVKKHSLSDTELVEVAGDLVHARGEDARLLRLGQEMEWRLGSGSAHGQLLVSMHRASGHRTEGKLARFGGTYDDIAQTSVSVFLVTNQAWRSWDLRSRR